MVRPAPSMSVSSEGCPHTRINSLPSWPIQPRMESLGSEQAAAKNMTRPKIVADVIIIMGSRPFSPGWVGGPSIRPVRASPSVRMTRLSRPVRCSPCSPAQRRCPAHGRQAAVVQYEAHRQSKWAENGLCTAGEGYGLGPCCGCCASDGLKGVYISLIMSCPSCDRANPAKASATGFGSFLESRRTGRRS